MWFTEGTLKSSQSIFLHLFNILGSTNQSVDENPQNIDLPYAYSLLKRQRKRLHI